jgi:hypothetical protein
MPRILRDSTLGREGRSGMRIIRMIRAPENTVSTDSSVSNDDGVGSGHKPGPRAWTVLTLLTLLTQKSAASAVQ